MKRLMFAAIAVAVLTAPAMAQSQAAQPNGQTQPNATPQDKKMQSQRDWQPEQKAARPPTHQGEEQHFGAGQPPSTVGQVPAEPQAGAIKQIPENELNPPPKETSK